MKQYYYKLKSGIVAGLSLFALTIAGSSAFGQLYLMTDNMHTFTNSGAIGKDGPSLAMCLTEYAGEAWTADPAFFNMTTNGIQEWTVPATGDYRIECAGAQGGRHAYTVDPEDGGLGAIMEGTFALTEGQIIYILVGQEGIDSQEGGGGSEDNAAPGGGGGSFVWDPLAPATPLVAAGGGAAGGSPGGYIGRDATTAIDGNSAAAPLVNGGIGGNGGRQNTGGSSYWGGGGAGWITNGTGGNQFTIYNYLPGVEGAEGGRRALEGGFGGVRWNDGFDEGGDGGFGGGGGGGSDNMEGGGGGGYSGGGGGRWSVYPGGGGSINTGSDQSNSVANIGMGYVKITQLCTPITVDALPGAGVCIGEEVTLTGTSGTGGTITWDGGVTNGVAFTPALGTVTYNAFSTSIDDCPFSIEVSASEVPTITATATPPSGCEGATVTLTGGGGDTYVWSGDDGSFPEDGVAFPSAEGTVVYTVIGSVLGCEAPPVDVSVTAASQPEVEGTATPAQICLGESYVLTGGGEGSTTFIWGGDIEDGDAITPDAAGVFAHILIGVSDEGCGDTTTVFVEVFPNPVVDAGLDVTVCEGDEVTLTGSSAFDVTFSWDGGVEDGVAFAAAEGTTTYTLTGTDINGCSDDDEVVVLGIDTPEITGSTVTPEYFGADGSIEIDVAGGSGTYVYSWSHGPITEDVFALVAGTYTVVIDDITIDRGMCPYEETFVIESFVGIEDNDINVLNAYPNPTNDMVTITYNGEFNYEVTSILGEVVMTGKAVDQEQLSLIDLANGTYIVKVVAGENISHVEIIKQ